jgi:hypothetical protein
MDANEKRTFRRLIPYFFSSYEPDDFDPALFEETIRLIFHTGYGKLLALLSTVSMHLGQPDSTPLKAVRSGLP